MAGANSHIFKAALLDLKTCSKNLNAGAAFTGSREDFVSDEAWHHWRMTELSHLSQLMVVLVQFNPEPAKSTPSEALPSVPSARLGSIYSFDDRTSPVPDWQKHGLFAGPMTLDVSILSFFRFLSCTNINYLEREETFDLSVEKPLWLMVSVRDRALVGKHDTVGRGYLCLDPRKFGDLLAIDLWFDLDSQGRILVRISMEGEKDDIQFYFGRGFRSLKRAEGDRKTFL